MKRRTYRPPRALLTLLSVVLLPYFATPVEAQDKIKVAVGQIDAWANPVPTLGMRLEFFRSTASFLKISVRKAPARHCRR